MIIGLVLIIIYIPTSFWLNRNLQSQFKVDSIWIKNTIGSASSSFSGSESYGSAALFYKLLGFSLNSPPYKEVLLSVLIYGIYIFFLVWIIKFNFDNVINLIIVCILSFFFATYYSVLSKDLIAFICICPSFLFFKNRYFIFFLVICIFFYGFFFRSYWLIFGIVLIISSNKNIRRNRPAHFFILLLVIVVFSVFYFKLDHHYVSLLRDNTHSVLSANTNIDNIFSPTNIVYDILNTLNTLINLIIPLNGLGSKNELVYYVILYFFIYIYLKNKNDNFLWLSIFVSFLISQSFFEPDMGSALRHQMVLYLYLYPILLSSKQTEENQ